MSQKPRNPYVAAAKFRRAGAHQKTVKARRRQEAVALIQKLRGLRRNGSEEVFLSTVETCNDRQQSLFTATRYRRESSPP